MTVFDNLFHAAEAWLQRGAVLIPLQPGTKQHVTGFGPHQRTISTPADARTWFQVRRCNLGVVVPEGWVCLDFDTPTLYGVWRSGEGAAFQGIIERSRGGYHVWGLGVASGLQPVASVEFKKPGQVVTVAPSRVDKTDYVLLTLFAPQALPFTTLTAGTSPNECLSPLTPKPIAPIAPGGDVIALIRAQVDILQVAKGLTTLRPAPNGAWVGNCPFHPDTGKHFWVAPAKGLWGCHSANCRTHGRAHDVINLVAEAEGLTVKDAIAHLYHEVAR